MTKIREDALVLRQDALLEDVFSLWIQSEAIAAQARAGQFLSLYCREGSRLLPRPISICQIDRERGQIRLVYRTVGAGTREFAACRAGDQIPVLGPLGNGFPEIDKDKSALLLGGGIGIPPMLEAARELACRKTAVLGYRDQMFLKEEFEPFGPVYVSSEDGSIGTRGNVLDAVRENGLTADVILACGPKPMLKAVKEYAAARGIECWLSLEERMACGVGACLACVCQTKDVDGHSNVHNRRVCKDGPVFRAEEVEL